jgi:PAS domain S-box-containing protein
LLSRFRASFGNSPLDETGEERIQSAFYVVFSLAAAALALQGALDGKPYTIVGACVFGGVTLLSWVLGRLGYYVTSRLLVPATVLVLVTALAWKSNGIHDIAVLFYPIVVIFSGLLLGAGAAALFAVICSAAATLLVWADIHGLSDSPAAVNSDYADAFAVTVMLGLSVALMRFAIQSLNRSLRTLRSSESALAESNRSLAARANEIRASEARWRSLVENAPDRIMNVAPDGSIVFANFPAGEPVEEPTPRSVYDLVADEDRSVLGSALRNAFAEAAPSTCEFRGADRDRWWSVRIGPIDAGGAVTGATLILCDISERKRTDADRSSLESQLHEAQRMEALGQLAGGVAHDFNNLLTVIAGNASLLEREVSTASSRESLAEIRASQERAASLVRQLLAFGRRQMLRPQVLDLRGEISGIEGMLRRLVGEHVEFAFLADGEAAPVLADPGQVEQVVVNLVLNARDAMPSGGRLELRLWSHRCDTPADVGGTSIPAGRYTVLSFADDGVGMDEDTRSRVFQPFFSTKPREKGSGLGLSSVYGIITQSGGYISVESEPMKGATFHVYLPESEDAAPGDALRDENVPVATGSESILVVEDSAPMRRLLRRVLGESGYDVHLSEDGPSALEAAAQCGPIELILTDLVMPGMNGKVFADQFQERFGPTPVIYMSGYTDEYLHPHRLPEDTVNFIQKPFAHDDLLALVRETLDSRRETG